MEPVDTVEWTNVVPPKPWPDPPPMKPPKEGMKFDEDKARFDLLPPDAMFELVRVYTFGAQKYNDRNWEQGIKWGRVFAAICRHCFNWLMGEEKDPESGIHHMAHAAWGCLALVAYTHRGMWEFDDRGTDTKTKGDE